LLPNSLKELSLDAELTSNELNIILNTCQASLGRFGLKCRNSLTNTHLDILIQYAQQRSSLKEVGIITDLSDSDVDQESFEKAAQYFKFVTNIWFDDVEDLPLFKHPL